MTKFKRAFCGILAAFLIISCPVRSYAIGEVVAAATVGGFSIGAVLAACGIVVAGGAVAVLIGTWTDRDTYLLKGAAKELGVYAQRVYDGARSASQEIKEKYEKIEETLIACVTSSWGQVITGIRAFVTDIKDFFKSMVSGYCTDATTYFVYADMGEFEFAKDNYVSSECFPLRSPASYTYAYNVINNAVNEFVFSHICASSFAGYAYVANFYKPKTVEIFGLASAVVSGTRVDFYMKDGETYKEYSFFYHYESAVDADGNYKYNRQDSCHGTSSYLVCDEKYIGNLPFPVFANLSAMKNYCTTGVLADIYKPGHVALPVESVNVDVQNSALVSIPDTITLPASKEVASSLLENISSALVEGKESLEVALENAGIGVKYETDTPSKPDPPPDDDKKKPAWLGWVIGEILDWLLGETIEDLIDWLLGETDKIKNDDEGEIIIEPVEGIKDKFPFCIPFDLIYLVQALEAESEVPRFEIPIDIDYEFIEYHEVFVVDFYDWITVVNVLHAMLDIWFVAGLIVATRNIMRG